jgi:Uma2 family endonuclease
MGWLIDPNEKIVFVYFRDRTLAIFENKSDLLPVPDFAEKFQLNS